MDNMFLITDGEKYIKCNINGKYKQVNNITMADIFGTRQAAMNVFLNSLCKAWQRTFYVAEYKNGKVIQSGVSKPPKAVKNNISDTYNIQNGNLGIEQWEQRLSGMTDLFSDAMKRNNELSQELSDVDAQITDVEHYIEFQKLNAMRGFKAYSKLHKLFEKRRAIKNEQKLVSVICKNINCSESTKEILKTVDDLKHQTYKPRILAELFRDGIEAIS